MSATDEIIEGVAEAFDELREGFFPGSVAKLLKPSEAENEFDTALELEGKWFFEDPNQFRSEFLFQVADNSDEMAAAMKEATHLRIDEDYYSIANADPTRPKGTGVTWKLLCNRDFSRNQYGSIY